MFASSFFYAADCKCTLDIKIATHKMAYSIFIGYKCKRTHTHAHAQTNPPIPIPPIKY